MQNSQTIKTGYFVALFMIVMLLPVNTFSAVQKGDNWLDKPVTVRFQHEPLSKVLEKVSQQTGIAILYDQELANEKVSGNYKDVKASDAITRLFSGKNKSIQVSKDEKVIVVKTFGAKNFIWAGASKGQDSSSPMTLAELEKLHAQQYKEYKERISDDKEFLPEVGMTRGDLKEMQEQQYKEFKVITENENMFLPEVGMTRGDLKKMQEQQYKVYKDRSVNDNVFLPEVDMTLGELGYMQEQQYKEYKKYTLNNEEYLPDLDMTRNELQIMQQKQYDDYNKQKL